MHTHTRPSPHCLMPIHFLFIVMFSMCDRFNYSHTCIEKCQMVSKVVANNWKRKLNATMTDFCSSISNYFPHILMFVALKHLTFQICWVIGYNGFYINIANAFELCQTLCQSELMKHDTINPIVCNGQTCGRCTRRDFCAYHLIASARNSNRTTLNPGTIIRDLSLRFIDLNVHDLENYSNLVDIFRRKYDDYIQKTVEISCKLLEFFVGSACLWIVSVNRLGAIKKLRNSDITFE